MHWNAAVEISIFLFSTFEKIPSSEKNAWRVHKNWESSKSYSDTDAVAGAAAGAAAAGAAASAVCILSCTYKGARSAPLYLHRKYIQQKQQQKQQQLQQQLQQRQQTLSNELQLQLIWLDLQLIWLTQKMQRILLKTVI